MQDIAEFISMGGYAAYVWPAFALTALVMAALLVSTLTTLRRRERRLRQIQAAAGGRRRRGQPDGKADSQDTALQ